MTESAAPQDPEGISAGAIWLVSAAVVAIGAGLVAIAWLLVVPPAPPEHPAAGPSPLERALFDRAAAGAELRAAGERQLERYQWIDRSARIVRIPIDRAIDAVVADPRLIGSPGREVVGAVAPPRAAAAPGDATAPATEARR